MERRFRIQEEQRAYIARLASRLWLTASADRQVIRTSCRNMQMHANHHRYSTEADISCKHVPILSSTAFLFRENLSLSSIQSLISYPV